MTHTVNDRSDAVTFAWNTHGTQAITVTAQNGWGAVSDTHVITINVPPSGVVISGPTAGAVNTTYTFTATVSPVTATQPITYVWQATGQAPVTHTVNDRSDAVTFAWNTHGTQAITVTAQNGWGAVSDTHVITVNEVVISGPTAGVVQVGYTFTASVKPAATTQPITYVWEATGQSPVTHTGGLSDTAIFTWTMPGLQACPEPCRRVITVTAMNGWGAVSDTHTITISLMPPTDVEISGPTAGVAQAGYIFTASVKPVTTTQPITYFWEATGQTPVTHPLGGLSDTVTFTWSTLGSQVITVTATNITGTVTDTHGIVIGNPSLNKSVSPVGYIARGGVLRYTIAYTNSGDVAITGLVITDVIPANTAFLRADDGGVYSGGQVAWTVGTIPSGAAVRVRFRVRVDKEAGINENIVNQATLAAASVSPFSTNAVTNTVANRPDFGLSVKQVVPTGGPLAPGDLLTYTIAYTNGGTTSAFSTVISDPLPSEVEPVGGGILRDGVVVWYLGTVPPEPNPDCCGVITFAVRVREGVSPGTAITNAAWIDASLIEPLWTDPVVVTTIYPLLTATKQVTPTGPVLPGAWLTYTIRVTNTGNLTATDVLITDTDPTGQSHQWSVGGLAPGATVAVGFSAQLGGDLADGTVVTNVATISATNAAQASSNVVTTTVRRPALTLHKRVIPAGGVLPGTVLTYTLHYTNSAPVPAANAVITDWLPTGVISLSTIPSLGTIPANGSGVVSFTAQVTVPLSNGTQLVNRATLGADYATPVDSNAVTNTVQAPDFAGLTLSTVPTSPVVRPGEVLPYTVHYTNSGHAASQNSYVWAPLSTHISYLSGGGYITASHAVSLQLGSIAVGASDVVFFSVRVHRPLTDGITLTQQVTLYDDLVPAVSSNAVTHTVFSVPDFTASVKEVTPIGAVVPGTVLTYTIRYTNTGGITATAVVISDTLPEGVAYVGGGNFQQGVITWTVGDVPIDTGGAVSFTVVALDTHTPLVNQATIVCDQTGPTVTNAVTTTLLSPILHVHKAASPVGAVVAGSLLTYTLTYTNVGTQPAVDTWIVDDVPPHTLYRSGGDITTTQMVSFSLGSVAAGAVGQRHFTVQTAEPLTVGTVITNSARFFYSPVYPAGVRSTAPLDVAGGDPFYPLGGSGGSYYYAQSFVATAPRLADAAVHIYGHATLYPDLRLHIWGDSGGDPDPTQVLASGPTIPGSDLTSAGQRYSLDFLYPLPLTVGVRYWLVIDGNVDRGSNGSAGTRYSGANPYPDGQFKYSDDPVGETWLLPDPNLDLDFLVTYREPPQSNVVATHIITMPTVQFSAEDYSVDEGAGTTLVTVTLSSASGLTVMVDYATGGGTATPAEDYGAISGTLTFTPGTTVRTFKVPIEDDSLSEANETVGLALSNPTNAMLGTPVSATLTILDDDVIPLTDATISGPTAGTVNTAYTFTATVSPLTATQPITYVWQATGQSPMAHTGGLSDTVTYNWNTPGTKIIIVMAQNGGGAVSDNHVIAINIPPSRVVISGPTRGTVNTAHTFTATVSPVTATLPITYVWQASEQPLVTHTVNDRSDTVIFTWSTSGIQAIAVTASNAGGAVNASYHIAIAEPVPDGDPYEPDDTCSWANAITTTGSVQVHTFHAPGDADWVSFQAISGTTYLIEALTPSDSNTDVVLELYGQCDGLPQESQAHTFSPDVRLQFEAPAGGTYYLRLNNHYPEVAGPDVSYQLYVRALPKTASPGALVLVAGRSRLHDPLQDNIHSVTKDVYRLFLSHGYTKGCIYYLATDLNLDPDNNGWPDDVDALASRDNLKQAITQWAVDKVGPDRAFTLYMMDHGGYDKFYLNGPSQTVSPNGDPDDDDIDGWLDDLEAAAPGVNVNVIVDACHSGSFIDLVKSVSQPGRVVIASTGAYALAYASQNGAVFSDAFVEALGMDMSLYASFQEARWAVGQAHPDQTPWLDDDGDGMPNQPQDGQVAQRRGFAYAGTFIEEKWPPYVVWASVRDVQEGDGVIEAKVLDDLGVLSVWAVVYKPSYVPPDPGETEEMPQEDLSTATLLDLDGDDVYSATYEGFDEIGKYRIVVYAVDGEGLEGRPKEMEVIVGWRVYLPLVLR